MSIEDQDNVVPLHENLKALGTSAVNKPLYEHKGVNKKFLEKFPSPYFVENKNLVTATVHIAAPEFTSLCPKTGQPDFATIIIDYIPDEWCVESKSLKLYLGSFRHQGEFHESCINRICNDLVELLNPTSIEVRGEFTARGGIAFQPTAEWHQEWLDHED